MSSCNDAKCVIRTSNHRAHYDGRQWWDNTEFRPPQPKFTPGRKRTERISERASALLTEARADTAPDDRVELPQTWDEAGWLAHAHGVLSEFLGHRESHFTTPEHLWPLLPDPAPEVDRRVLVRVVRQALREGRIREVSARRLNDTYSTADGATFKINKLVPVYEPVR